MTTENEFGIKTTELKIGNWFWCTRNCTYAKVEAFIPKENEVDFSSGKFSGIKVSTSKVWIEFDQIEPIPLTPEILEKAGFILKPNQVFTNKYELNGITIDAGDQINTFIEGNRVVHLYYLHQLQNLYFALTGEELEINL